MFTYSKRARLVIVIPFNRFDIPNLRSSCCTSLWLWHIALPIIISPNNFHLSVILEHHSVMPPSRDLDIGCTFICLWHIALPAKCGSNSFDAPPTPSAVADDGSTCDDAPAAAAHPEDGVDACEDEAAAAAPRPKRGRFAEAEATTPLAPCGAAVGWGKTHAMNSSNALRNAAPSSGSRGGARAMTRVMPRRRKSS